MRHPIHFSLSQSQQCAQSNINYIHKTQQCRIEHLCNYCNFHSPPPTPTPGSVWLLGSKQMNFWHYTYICNPSISVMLKAQQYISLMVAN